MKRQPPFLPNFAGPVEGIYNPDPDAPYLNGNPATGQEGSIPPMEAVDHPQKELHHLIAHSGQTPSHEDLEQVRKAVKKMIEDGTLSNPVGENGVAIWEGLDPVTKHHKIRGLLPGTNVAIDLVEEPSESGTFLIRISAAGGSGGGEGGNPLANVGDGAQVYKGFNEGDEQEEFRTLKGINGIAVTQGANVVTVDGSGFAQFLPFFPEVETVDGKLAVSASTGQVVVAADQSFIHRGCRRILTSATDAGNRTFATAANKIYHLRWRWNLGVPVYELKDLADGGYNPGVLAESAPAFDTKYDDMIIARVVTNAENVPTVTALVNRSTLRTVLTNSGTIAGTTSNLSSRAASETYNWARKPDLLPTFKFISTGSAGSGSGGGGFTGSAAHDHDQNITINSVTRYAWSLTLERDYAYDMDVNVLMLA